MYVYLFHSGPVDIHTEGSDDIYRHHSEKVLARIRELLPGIRNLTGQLDYILAGKQAWQVQVSGAIGEYFKAKSFVENLEKLSPGAAPEIVSKEINKLIGKERVLLVADEELWVALLRFLVRDSSAIPEFTPPHYTLAEIHIKGFPGPGAGALNWMKSDKELLPADSKA